MMLITGGAGFIGSNFLFYQYRKNPNQKIVVIDNLTYAANIEFIRPLIENQFITLIQRDISNLDQLTDIFEKFQPKTVIHFAAESHVDNSILNLDPFVNTNIIGTINLLKCSSRLKNFNKFIHISTDEVYGSLNFDSTDKFKETDKFETNSPYSASKAASDCFVRAFYKTYKIPAIITNCSNNYGPNQHREKFIPTIINQARENKPIPVYGNGKNVRDWIFVEDHCRAIDLIIEHGIIGEKYNIGSDNEISNLNLVHKILAILDKPRSLINFVNDRPGHDLRYAIDYSKISDNLGFKPIYSLESGLEKTIEWYLNV